MPSVGVPELLVVAFAAASVVLAFYALRELLRWLRK